jgi:two-component system OmpR family response regulator
MTDTGLTRLLLVDDEPSLREALAVYLTRQGFAVDEAASAAEARQMLRETAPDLVLLDIMMPGEDGLSLCRHLVETRAIPTIFLTARGEPTDRIVGLEIGADDYVVKPFEPRELVARIRSVLRRAARGPGEAPLDEDFLFEGWRLDPLKRRLTAPDGALVAISSVEYRLLLAFLEHPRQVLDRDRLLDMVQGREAHLFDRAVDNQVSRLRRKIETDSRNPQMIQTDWGGGYMLAADVRRTTGDVRRTTGDVRRTTGDVRRTTGDVRRIAGAAP